jgi:hypothetical protein
MRFPAARNVADSPTPLENIRVLRGGDKSHPAEAMSRRENSLRGFSNRATHPRVGRAEIRQAARQRRSSMRLDDFEGDSPGFFRSTVDAMLAIERRIVPQRPTVRARALSRARTAVETNHAPSSSPMGLEGRFFAGVPVWRRWLPSTRSWRASPPRSRDEPASGNEGIDTSEPGGRRRG